jgi:homoisocitrate dehydrogenase
MTHTITLIPGDGIGQEVIPAARKILESLDLPLTFQEAEAGFGTFEQYGDALPAETLRLCEASDAILFGATQSPMTKVAGYQSPILSLRQHFDLFANLRPAVNDEIDMLIVRENTEGLYSRRERLENDGQTAIAERVITAAASERIVRVACEQAMQRRKKLTLVHKANVLKETCGLFREVALAVTRDYPALTVAEKLVDAAAMFMVQDPTRFDVIVTTNLFGDILSDLAAGLTGGLGLAPSANVGVSRPGVFEPVHGSAPDIAGRGTADPRAAILSTALMLDDLGYHDAARQVRRITYATPHTGRTVDTVCIIHDTLQ